MIDLTFADRLRETIERKIRLRGAFSSQALIEDNEREIRKAQHALRAVEEAEVTLGSQCIAYHAWAGELG